MKLTIEKAKELSKRYLLESGIKEGNFSYAHTKGVVIAAKLLAKREKVNEETLEKVAWVHDIGYFNSLKNHSEKSIKLLEKEGIELDKIEKDCILNHGSSAIPKTKEGKIMQIADKISIINKDFLREMLKEDIGDKEINYMKKTFNKCLERLKDLEIIS